MLNILQLIVVEGKWCREGRGGSTFYIEVFRYPILRKNSGETKLHNFVPHIKHLNACTGLIIPCLSSPSGSEFHTDNRSVLLDGQVSLCAFIVHGKCCTEILADVDLIVVVVVVVIVLRVALEVAVIAIGVTVAVLVIVAAAVIVVVLIILVAVAIVVAVIILGYAVTQLVEALLYNLEGRGFD